MPLSRFLTIAMTVLVASSCTDPGIDEVGLLDRVEVLASDEFEGRAAGSSGGEKARALVEDAFRSAGLAPLGTEGFEQAFEFVRRSGDSVRAVNMLGLVEGTAHPDQYIVLSAHYDHLGIRDGAVYNGADDNASGTSAIIAIAEQLVRHRPRHSVVIAAFDAEEGGLRGARHFVENPTVPLDAVLMNINLDMVSRSEAGELYAAGTYHYPELRSVLDEFTGAPEVKLLFGHDEPDMGHDDWTRSSDHGPFHGAGIPFVYFGVEDHPGYHQPEDDFDAITADFYVGAVNLIYRALVRFDAALPLASAGD